MSEVSTRVWLDERLWQELAERAAAGGETVRDLIPRLVRQGLAGPVPQPVPGPALEQPARRIAPEPPAPAHSALALQPELPRTGPGGLPVIVLSDLYHCDVCGGQVKLGGLTIHMGKHMKERQSAEAERS